MTQEHPITPPPKLVEQWNEEWLNASYNGGRDNYIAIQAARWGADQELEACCEWLDQNTGRWDFLAELRAARRPKPQGLKEQALDELDRIQTHDENGQEIVDLSVIRRALEALPD